MDYAWRCSVELEGTWYVGLDLGSREHEVAVCDPEGREVHSFKMPRGREGHRVLREEVDRCVPSVARAVYLVEAAGNLWQEVVHPLEAAGEDVCVLSPVKCSDLRKFYRRHTKTDAIDALATARVGVSDHDLRRAWVGTPEQESLRRLCRLSWKLSMEGRDKKRRLAALLELVLPGIGKVWRNRYCNSARLFYRRYLDPAKARRLGRKRLGEVLRRRAWGKFSEKKLAQLWSVIENAPELQYRYDDLVLEVRCELDGLEAIERRREMLMERIEELYTGVDPAHRLESVPGLGGFLGAALTSAVGDVGRWSGADQLVASSGLVPRKRASSGREKANQRLTKYGDPMLRSWLYVAAELVRHYDPELQAFYMRLRRRGKHHNTAICAVATKLLRRIYAVLRDETTYRVIAEARIHNAEKPVRESVNEVAQALLKDQPDTASPEQEYIVPSVVARTGLADPTGTGVV
jgi:transposase